MKLNIGSGVIRMDGYLNLDICPDKEPDILASCLQTGLGDNSVEEIYCSHLIEHLDKNELKQFANESFRILQSGGKFYSVCPSFEGAIKINCLIFLINLLILIAMNNLVIVQR